MRRSTDVRALLLLASSTVVVTACEQPVAPRSSPVPAPNAEIAAPATVRANPADLARAQVMLGAALAEYNQPRSSYRFAVDQIAQKTQRLAMKRSRQ